MPIFEEMIILMRRIRMLFLKRITRFILHSNDYEILAIEKAVTTRYKNKFPDWEVLLLSLPKDPRKREQTLLQIVDFYRNHPEI